MLSYNNLQNLLKGLVIAKTRLSKMDLTTPSVLTEQNPVDVASRDCSTTYILTNWSIGPKRLQIPDD